MSESAQIQITQSHSATCSDMFTERINLYRTCPLAPDENYYPQEFAFRTRPMELQSWG